MTTTSSVILHIPHSSTYIPEELRQQFCLTDAELQKEILVMTDWFTDELFNPVGLPLQRICFPVSRLVVDPERFLDIQQEQMASRGMGVVYTRTSSGRPLRRALSDEERNDLIARYYHSHHQHLTDSTERAIAANGRCLVLDCHSFPSRYLPYELDQDSDRPDICIGTDDFHTPDFLNEQSVRIFQSFGLKVAVNKPFGGALVPMKYYGRDKRVSALMIEINRALYMDELTGRKLESFQKTRHMIQAAVDELRTK